MNNIPVEASIMVSLTLLLATIYLASCKFCRECGCPEKDCICNLPLTLRAP